MNLYPCGDTIHFDSERLSDERGHSVVYVHKAPMVFLAAGITAVARLHVTDPEGFIPMCIECGKPSPCPTIRALGDMKEIE